MRVVYAPESAHAPSIFLGGSITGAWNWQEHVIDTLSGDLMMPLTIYNPRRDNFDVSDPDVEREQIEWEFRHLRIADALIFWFSGETLAPITLFELGRHSIIAGRPLFIGIDPEYKRKRDVVIQMSLVDPDIPIYYSIQDVTDYVKSWVNKWHMRQRALPYRHSTSGRQPGPPKSGESTLPPRTTEQPA